MGSTPAPSGSAPGRGLAPGDVAPARTSGSERTGRVAFRIVASLVVGVHAVVLAATGLLAWWWARLGEAMTCPIGADGEPLRLEGGGWAEPSWCEGDGAIRPVIHQDIAWFEPLPLSVVMALGSLAVAVGAVAAVRRLWVAPLLGHRAPGPLTRAATVLHACALGAVTLVFAVFGMVGLTQHPSAGLPFSVVAASAGLAAYVLLRPAGAPPLLVPGSTRGVRGTGRDGVWAGPASGWPT